MKETMSIDELFERFKSLSQEELVLDVRTPEEFREGHVPGSRNISHEQVAQHARELEKYQAVYIVCRSGGRVQMAAADLKAQGLRNFSIVTGGGVPDWISNGYPTEK